MRPRVQSSNMGSTSTGSPGWFLTDALVSTLVSAGLHGLGQGVRFLPVQLPRYVLVVRFDAIEAVLGVAGPDSQLLFAGYVLGLGTVGAALSAIGLALLSLAAWLGGVRPTNGRSKA